ncbi:MAG: threonine synthase [Ruminococcaceae bacterium]|nr:threonine synthase [Oscillospiraceae bacterium]
MNYVSTRGGTEKVSGAYAIKKGLCDNGGLFMPEYIPTISKEDIDTLCTYTYAQRAAYIMGLYLDEYKDILPALCEKAYSEERFGKDPAVLSKIYDNFSVMELWHGPTCAFKDMALQIMPLLLSNALKITGEKRDACVLVATSGDTGKAALEGYKDVDQIKISVFYPDGGVSKTQKLQMATQEGANVNVFAIKGNFDDAQSAVKSIFTDESLNEEISSNAFLSSANSINWGRLVPQIVYYVSAYCDLINKGSIKNGDYINVTVPTGNFGNIFAAYLAREMGLPIRNLVCASNTNNILTDFFKTGIYNRNRRFYQTISPSMDILISSNLERLLYLIEGPEATKQYMQDLSEKKMYRISGSAKKIIDNIFYAGWCDEAMTTKMINHAFHDFGYLCDTHTAVALRAARDYMRQSNDDAHMVVASTASAYKFSGSVYTAITGETCEDEFEAIKRLSEVTKTEIPKPILALFDKKPRFDKVIEASDMRSIVKEIALG